jgi:hypothetical protein
MLIPINAMEYLLYHLLRLNGSTEQIPLLNYIFLCLFVLLLYFFLLLLLVVYAFYLSHIHLFLPTYIILCPEIQPDDDTQARIKLQAYDILNDYLTKQGTFTLLIGCLSYSLITPFFIEYL